MLGSASAWESMGMIDIAVMTEIKAVSALTVPDNQ
jgi:hypothetical protein